MGDKAHHKLDKVLVQLPNGDIQPVTCAIVVNAAGPRAGHVRIFSL